MDRRCVPTCRRSSQREEQTPVAPDPALVGRFSADLDRLAPTGTKIGIAVSGGPDSLALLLLASAARPGAVEAATVDHWLRAESAEEAAMVAHVCETLGVPHATLTVKWKRKPETAIQERARAERYRLLGRWAAERELAAVATAHHADDQAETLLMRLNRGVGVRGLAGMRPIGPLPTAGKPVRLIRPLLGWRHSELVDICRDADAAAVSDPSNFDEQFERVRIRRGLADAPWLHAAAIAGSAAKLASADAALAWAADLEWERQVKHSNDVLTYAPSAPFEIRRRIVARAIAQFASEGQAKVVRGQEIDRLMAVLSRGGKATLRGVLCSGGKEWRFSRAPGRRAIH